MCVRISLIDVVLLCIMLTSLEMAVKAVAVSSGLSAADSSIRPVAFHAAYAVIYWPLGVLQTLGDVC